MTRLIACMFSRVLTLLLGLAPMLALSNNVLAHELKPSSTEPVQCSRSSSYDIYLSGIHTGTMKRTEKWQGKTAVVTSNSKASILGIGTQYQQRAELFWSNQTNEWLTEQFHQKVTGFRARDMQATFSDNGRSSQVDIDGDIESYRSNDIALRDVDTLAIQMREYLLRGRQQFALIRQASDAMEPYQFYVQQPQTTEIAPWGELSLIPVKQTGAEEVTYYFAPAMDYQLVKARYHGIILRGLIQLNHYSSSCD
ncbi:conserved hypothetical protein [Shewanella halifaxensis HAW-EB4]|uniref:DUF3108 domain-containing protein n=1 Tax=Shewanella halifaxensis (strain HAW-EB4) TaxID=458817 RepID=B0TV26_SHEHH|nr:hypothetical protein [Shewanella halifaxensis]ABZ78293.1 conserved hypothetical protein [Shewanella halifaxensis HAW-EB4]